MSKEQIKEFIAGVRKLGSDYGVEIKANSIASYLQGKGIFTTEHQVRAYLGKSK